MSKAVTAVFYSVVILGLGVTLLKVIPPNDNDIKITKPLVRSDYYKNQKQDK